MSKILTKPRREKKPELKKSQLGSRAVRIAKRGKPKTIQNEEGFYRP